MKQLYALVNLDVKGDRDGNLVAIERGSGLLFDIKRVYYIWGTKHHALRGRHAHKDLEQLIVCLSGSCEFRIDDGSDRVTVRLCRRDQGLYLRSPLWREFTNFSNDCVLMVLASRVYDPDDYIHDYDEFLKYQRTNKLVT